MSNEGLMTPLQTGVTTVTVINNGTEQVIPVLIDAPDASGSQVGAGGGAISSGDGAIVTVAAGALTNPTPVSIQQLGVADLSLPLPAQYNFHGGFQLELGNRDLEIPAQIVIPNTTNLPVGQEVFFLRQGELPNEQGVMQPIWFLEESGRVADDGTIRTSSPPWNGVTKTGTYTVVTPSFNYSYIEAKIAIEKAALITTGLVTLGLLAAGLAFVPSNDLVDYVTEQAFGVTTSDVLPGVIEMLLQVPVLLDSFLPQQQVSLLSIPTYGLPTKTTTNVEINGGQIKPVSFTLNANNTFSQEPTVNQIEFKLEPSNNGAKSIIYLTGKNFAAGITKVETILPNQQKYQMVVDNALSDFSDPNNQKLAVKFDPNIPFNPLAKLQVTVTYPTGNGNPIERKSEKIDIPNKAVYPDLALVPQAWQNQLVVFNTTKPKDVIAQTTPDPNDVEGSPNLLLAKIPLATGSLDPQAFIGAVAVTRDGIAYAPLVNNRGIAVVDLMTLNRVNANQESNSSWLEPWNIQLPADARPIDILLSPDEQYAYVLNLQTVNGVGRVFVIDLNPQSTQYHKVIQNIDFGTNLTDIRNMAISADGRTLFITAPRASDKKGHIIAIDIERGSDNFHHQVADLKTKLGIIGISAAPLDVDLPGRVQMLLTNGFEESEGFSSLTINDGNWQSPEFKYAALGLGDYRDFFDVNNAVDVTVTPDGKYAFIAGKNAYNWGNLIPSVDADPRAGSSVGIIKDPLGNNPQLIAMTRPIPDGWVNGLALSGDGKTLTAAYQGLGFNSPGVSMGGVFMFDVEEIIKTIENIGNYTILTPYLENNLIPNQLPHQAELKDLEYIPIDSINPKIDMIAADLVRDGNEFFVPDDSRTDSFTLNISLHSCAMLEM